jgi:hypothetical protein
MSKKTAFQTVQGNHNYQAEGDIHNSNNNYYYSQSKTKMQNLIDEYEREQQQNIFFNSIIEDLNYYLNPVKLEVKEIIGLEKKLRLGNFDEFIDYAMRAKELFSQKLEKYRLSKVAQKIFLYILAEIWTLFHHKIYQLICDNKPHDEIMKMINDEILVVIEKKLEDNVLDIYSDCITGMVYFLTGNCHINWSKV